MAAPSGVNLHRTLGRRPGFDDFLIAEKIGIEAQRFFEIADVDFCDHVFEWRSVIGMSHWYQRRDRQGDQEEPRKTSIAWARRRTPIFSNICCIFL